MRVHLKVYSTLKEITGQRLIQLDLEEGSTVNDVVKELEERIGREFEEKTGHALKEYLEKRLNIFLDGKILKLPRDYDLQLKENTELVMVMPVGGGAHTN